jgi:hypothetical protein
MGFSRSGEDNKNDCAQSAISHFIFSHLLDFARLSIFAFRHLTICAAAVSVWY